MGILSSKPNSYLGVDLSPDAIKLVELKAEKGKPQLITYGYTESKGDVLKGDFISNKNITSTLLKEVSDRAKVTTNLALAALPPSLVFSSVLKLSGVIKKDLDNKSKIKDLISDEIKKILPRPLEEMTFDFNLIRTDKVEQADQNTKLDSVKFLITAATNEVIKDYVDIFKQSGFQLTNLDIEGFALVRSLVGSDRSLILLVDIGENRTNLSIVNLTIPVLNRSIAVGGAAFTRAISDSLNITISEAENYKLDLGIMMSQENMQEYPKPVEAALAPIVTEIKYLIKTYYDQTGREKQLDKIILTGGGSLIGNHLDKYLSKVLDIRTYVGDPWARVVYPEELKPVLFEIGPRFSVALGLAMREII
ncbi:MAG: type IV pilus assembly protein PilM [Candidatus Buchananbacteria bacterium]|nr:type IV pilus assembly protein PilM [Candidatus Buchananbacteria bacterium]